MKKLFVSVLNFIKYEYLEIVSLVLLLFWATSPLVELFLKYNYIMLFSHYYVLALCYIGILGIIEYIIYLCKIIKDKKFKFKFFVPHIMIIILLILGIISTILSKNPHLSFFGESYRREGLLVYIYYIGFVLSASIIKNPKYIKGLFKTIVIVALYVSVKPTLRWNFTFYQFSNVFFNLNHYGYFLMIAVLLAGFMFMDSKKYTKIFYILAYIVLLFMLIKNDTFGCYLSIIITFVCLLLYSLIKKVKRLDVISLIIVFALTSFFVSHYNIGWGIKYNDGDSNVVKANVTSFRSDLKILFSDDKEALKNIGSYRGILWLGAIESISENPLVGSGFESLKEYYYAHNIYINDRPHNILLQISAFMGIPSAIIYLVLICYLALTNLKNLKDDIVNITIYFTAMAYFISSQFGNSMFYTSPYFMILVGMLIGMRKKELSNVDN